MRRIAISIILGLMGSIVPTTTYPQQSGDQAVAEAMARAQAEKARNDRIVEQQRAAEKAQKENARSSPAPSEKSKADKSTPGKSTPDKSKPEKSTPK